MTETNAKVVNTFEELDKDIRTHTSNFIFEGKQMSDFAKHQWFLRVVMGEILYTTNMHYQVSKSVEETLKLWSQQEESKELKHFGPTYKTLININDAASKRVDQIATFFKQLLSNELRGVAVKFSPKEGDLTDELIKLCYKSPVVDLDADMKGRVSEQPPQQPTTEVEMKKSE